jgi:hypothetical protein
MTIVLVFATFAALIWSAYKYYSVYSALVDSFPPELRGSTARYALPQFALRSSTPLELQADYVASQIGGCLALFFLSLPVFSVGQNGRRLALSSDFPKCRCVHNQSARTYWQNRQRAAIEQQKDEL